MVSKWWGNPIIFEVLGIKAKASDLVQKRRYSQTPVLLQMAHLHIQCPLVLLHHGLQNAMTRRKKKTHRIFAISCSHRASHHVPATSTNLEIKEKKHLPVPRTVRNVHVFTGNLGLSDIEEVILTLSIFLHSLEGLQKPQQRSFPPKSLQIT